MTSALRLLALCLLALLAATALAGCGNRLEIRTQGDTEGLYIDISELKYQVQVSRILNPADVEDRAYLRGVAPGDGQPTAEENWFAVFIRVQNTGSETRPTASQFEIIDTVEKKYRPVRVDNDFAYRAGPLEPKGIIPTPDSLASEGPVQGSLLLFKVENESLQNRPLEFRIVSPENPEEVGIIDLDV